MKFVETAELKVGMRLARPIYNKQGVLLFGRDSRLTKQTIESVNNFGLLGVYTLEPAEPLPPMSDEDMEFEQFQIMTVFSMQDELQGILDTGRQTRLENIAATILKKYGYLGDKITFYQNLRGRDDFVCRHSLNTAIFCAMITRVMKVMPEEQLNTVYAAIVHDIGKLQIDKKVLFGPDEDGHVKELIVEKQRTGLELLDNALSNGSVIRRICSQAWQLQYAYESGEMAEHPVKMSTAAKILMVANRYDEITAISLQGTAESEVKAIRELYEHPDVYDPKVVDALVRSINIVFPGVSVELNTGEKALVVTENPEDILRPVVLIFRDNTLLDLSLRENQDIQIEDVMKTLDNRYIMRTEDLPDFPQVKKPEKDADEKQTV